jgi:hypothetical protein
MKRTIVAVAAAALCAGASMAGAQTLYKLIDKNGKVTYTETPPKDFPGQVIRIDVNPEANRATLPKLEPRQAAPDEGRAASGGSTASAGVATARERLEAVQRALQQARDNPSEEEVQIIGNKGAGVRFVPTEVYRAKLEKLEQDVKAAEEELRRAEGR